MYWRDVPLSPYRIEQQANSSPPGTELRTRARTPVARASNSLVSLRDQDLPMKEVSIQISASRDAPDAVRTGIDLFHLIMGPFVVGICLRLREVSLSSIKEEVKRVAGLLVEPQPKIVC